MFGLLSLPKNRVAEISSLCKGNPLSEEVSSLESSFSFLLECPLFLQNEGSEKKELYGVREMTFPHEGKYPSSHLCLKRWIGLLGHAADWLCGSL